VLLKLASVYDDDRLRRLTYDLFFERQNNPYLSHVDVFPSWGEQNAYINTHPYTHWYGAYNEMGIPVSAVWVDPKQSGVYTLERWQRKGYGLEAMRQLIEMHPEMPYTAYIHCHNIGSIRLHRKLGFTLAGEQGTQVIYKFNPQLSSESS
jgi:RimJ/RimL family protein N-acetyltransferase